MVRDAKKTIRIERVNLSRDRRRSRTGGDEDAADAWTADIQFVDHIPKG